MCRITLRIAVLIVLPGTGLLVGCASAPDLGVRKIDVDGKGVVHVKPDLFVIDMEVIERNVDLPAARKAAGERSLSIIAAAKTFPLDWDRTRTEGFSVSPRYDRASREFVGYDVSQELRFYLTDVARAEEFTVAMLNAGATKIDWVSFRTSTEEELKARARELALRDARAKAEAAATVLGERVGVPIVIRTGSGGGSSYLFSSIAYEDDLNSSDWVAPSEIDIEADVNVEFALRGPREGAR
jgi:uncharacterized protein YggE